MSARDDILERVRARIGRTDADTARERTALRNVLDHPLPGPRPAPRGDRTERFVARSLALASTVARVADDAQVPGAVAAYLRDAGLPPQLVCVPAVSGYDWGGAGLAAEVRPAGDTDPVGLTGCFCAVAETGTLMLCSSADSPAATSLLPETHIAVVHAARIVDHMEDAFALLRRELQRPPRAINFVSGPSRTADIEQTIVLGAHGPYRVHLVVVEDAKAATDTALPA